MPALDGTILRVVAVNSGDAPATLAGARMHSNYLAPATKVRLRNDDDAIIPPGSKLLTFDIVPLLDEDTSYRDSLEIMGSIISNKDTPKTDIVIGLQQSDGSLGILTFDIDANDMLNLLRANADRCSAIKEPNFVNGCIGAGSGHSLR